MIQTLKQSLARSYKRVEQIKQTETNGNQAIKSGGKELMESKLN